MVTNITIITATEKGGAGHAAKNLYLGLLESGYHVSFLTVDDLKIKRENVFARLYRRWCVRKNVKRNFEYLTDAPTEYDYFSFARTGYQNLHRHPLVKSADVINLHWISNMIDYKSFFKNVDKPVIWTLHDTNDFTGGCHYTFQCELFKTDCGNCFQLSEKYKKFAAKDNLRLKQDSLKTLPVQKTIVVSPSNWLKGLSEESLLFKNYRHFQIPYGIDTDNFNQYDQVKSRNRLKLPLNKFIILFVGTSLLEARKGFDVILKLREVLKERDDILFVAIGKINEPYEGILNLGFITDKNEIALAYNAANVFLIPSREDNLPNTMLESLCCGTPVIGYKTGGIVDAIDHGSNGFLVDKEDINSIVQHIDEMTDQPALFDNQTISQLARKKYSIKNQARLYKELILDEF